MGRKPATYGCANCNKTYAMGKETTCRIYLKQPWFNHIEVKCPAGCRQIHYVWYVVDETISHLENNNQDPRDPVNFEVSDYAPDSIVFLFCRDNNKRLPEEPWISPRKAREIEHECAVFAFTLQLEEVPEWLT